MKARVGVRAAEGGFEHDSVDPGAIDDRLDLVATSSGVPVTWKPRIAFVRNWSSTARTRMSDPCVVPIDERLSEVGVQVGDAGVRVDAGEVDARDPGEHHRRVIQPQHRFVLGPQRLGFPLLWGRR